ncbi:MAG: hypothetical protein ACK5QT_07550 [Oligoflexia bacterium]
MRAALASVWVLGAWMILLGQKGVGHPFEGVRHLSSIPQVHAGEPAGRVRAAMLKALEDLVQRERIFFRQVGFFTPGVERLEFKIPGTFQGEFDVRVARADGEHLLVEAVRGQGTDRVWMNEQFEVRANFSLRGLGWVMLEKSGLGAPGSHEKANPLELIEIEPLSAQVAAD